MEPSQYLNQCWNSVNSKLKNKLQWNLKRNSYIFIEKKNAFENGVCERQQFCHRLDVLSSTESCIFVVSKDRLGLFHTGAISEQVSDRIHAMEYWKWKYS